jgi:hypothetical protein
MRDEGMFINGEFSYRGKEGKMSKETILGEIKRNVIHNSL